MYTVDLTRGIKSALIYLLKPRGLSIVSDPRFPADLTAAYLLLFTYSVFVLEKEH